MPSIPEILNYPDQAPIPEVQGRIASVYARRDLPGQYGVKSVQNALLEDSVGNKVELSVWEHPELNPLVGKEIIVHANKGKGVKMRHSSYLSKKTGEKVNKKEIEVGKYGTFQLVEVHQAQTRAADTTALPPQVAQEVRKLETDTRVAPTPAAPQGKPRIEGVLVGMAINNACNLIFGEPFNPVVLHRIASDIIRVSLRLQQGDLSEVKTLPDKSDHGVDPEPF